jgi:hypothetical protein
MCLHKVTETFNPNKRVVKGFKKIEGSTFTSYPRGIRLKAGVWMQARKRPTTIGYVGGKYENGFHIFKSRNAARDWTSLGRVVEVKGRDLRAIGTQYGVVFVCKELFIAEKAIKPKKTA